MPGAFPILWQHMTGDPAAIEIDPILAGQPHAALQRQ